MTRKSKNADIVPWMSTCKLKVKMNSCPHYPVCCHIVIIQCAVASSLSSVLLRRHYPVCCHVVIIQCAAVSSLSSVLLHRHYPVCCCVVIIQCAVVSSLSSVLLRRHYPVCCHVVILCIHIFLVELPL